jgi:photosystem II stability/assembly factor-like uncharacterized protein
MLLFAVLVLLAGIALLLSRPVGQWVASVQPTATMTPTAVPTVTPTITPTATPVTPTPTVEPRAAAARPQPAPTSSPAQNFQWVQMIDEQRGWAQGNDSAWRTQDGGNTWVNVTPTDFESHLSGVSTYFLSSNEAWFLAPVAPSTTAAATLYRTSDSGRTWSASSAPFGMAGLFFLNAQEGWAIIQDHQALTSATRLFATQDGGKTWTSVHQVPGIYNEGPGQLPRLSWLNRPVFLNSNEGWIGGSSAQSDGDVPFYTTQNGGETWQMIDLGLRQQYPGRNIFVSSPLFSTADPSQGTLPVLVSSDGSQANRQWIFFATQDGGERWQARDPVHVEQGAALFSAPSSQDLFVLDGDQISISQDGGENWQRSASDLNQVRLGSGNEAGIFAIQFVNRRTGWAWGIDRSRFYLYRTHDAGKNWFVIHPVGVSETVASCDVEMISLGRTVETVEEPGDYTGWSIYRPSGYSFSFYYPPGWRLLEQYRLCPGQPPTMNSVMLLPPREQGAYLVVGFRRLEEPAAIVFRLPEAGEWVTENTVSFWGKPVSRNVLVIGGESRAIFYNAGLEMMVPVESTGEMVFTLTLLGRGETGEEMPLSPEVQLLADQVIQSFQSLEITSALLESMDVYGFISISPDGQWQAETLTALPIPGSGPVDQKLQRITVYSGSDSRPPWIIEEQWLPNGAGVAFPSNFIWSPDNDSLYFFETVYPDGCQAYPLHQNLRRARLNSQQLEEIALLAPEMLPNLGIAPDTRRLAYLSQVESAEAPQIRIRDLENGQETAVLYPFPSPEQTWNSGDIFWSPDSRRLVFTIASQTCEYQKQKRQVLLIDPQQRSARPLTTLEENLRIVQWEADGSLIVEDQAGSRFQMDVDSGEKQSLPPDPLEKARSTLQRFLNPLANAPGEPGIYETVVELYGGDWDELIRLNMGANPQDRAAMLRLSCERSGRHCLKLRRIVSEEALSESRFQFVVELMNRDGSLFELDGSTQFPFVVERGEDGRYRVMQLPP